MVSDSHEMSIRTPYLTQKNEEKIFPSDLSVETDIVNKWCPGCPYPGTIAKTLSCMYG